MHTVLGKVISGYFERKKRNKQPIAIKQLRSIKYYTRNQCSMKTILKYFLLSDKNNEDIDLVDLIM